jgi:exodeoxyribonuclease VII large subunit
VAERVADQASRLERAARFQVLHARQKLDSVPVDRAERRISGNLRRMSQRLDDLEFRLDESTTGLIRTRQREVAELAGDVLHHEPRQMLARARERMGTSETRIERSMERTLRRASALTEALDARLRSLSPLAVLERGYALVMSEDGAVVRSAMHVHKGERLRTRLTDGEFGSTVSEVRSSPNSTN